MPHSGHAKRATSSSTKPNVPTKSPTPSLTPIRSVITKDTLLLRKTRKDIENRQTAKRYAHACAVVVEDANGRYLDTENILEIIGMVNDLVACRYALMAMMLDLSFEVLQDRRGLALSECRQIWAINIQHPSPSQIY